MRRSSIYPLVIVDTVLAYNERTKLVLCCKESVITLRAIKEKDCDSKGSFHAFLIYSDAQPNEKFNSSHLEKVGRLARIHSMVFDECAENTEDPSKAVPSSVEVDLVAMNRAYWSFIPPQPPFFVDAHLLPGKPTVFANMLCQEFRKLVSLAIKLNMFGGKFLDGLKFAIKHEEDDDFLEYVAKVDDLYDDDQLFEILHSMCEEERIAGMITNFLKYSSQKATKDQMKQLEGSLNGKESPSKSPSKKSTSDPKSLKERVEASNIPKALKESLLKEITAIDGDHTKYSSYLQMYADFVISLPWVEVCAETSDLEDLRTHLDEHHFGLEKVKKRVGEFLAIRKLKKNSRGPILCLNGPPGVGKTSIASSVAKALGLPFHKIALGGISDIHDLKGHRRTYVGALPGMLMQCMQKAKVKNPVILLDEIDKCYVSSRNNIFNVLLEILDPEQNSGFMDTYINHPFDLSKVLFIATSNCYSDIPAVLRDRLEIINIPGYTEIEKVQIAQNHLIPREVTENGLGSLKNPVHFPKNIVETIIHDYTDEPGVRKLKNHIGSVFRSVAVNYCTFVDKNKELADNEEKSIDVLDFTPPEITKEYIVKVLGVPEYVAMKGDGLIGIPGVAVGLAVSGHGGTLLIMESRFMDSSGLKITGHLAEVMKESVEVALGCAYSLIKSYKIRTVKKKESGIHIHFPEGAIEKDGPSAGVAICCCFLSLLSGIPLHSDVAMTGEITLHGNILMVGGIPSKLLAAVQNNIKRVFIPSSNKPQLEKVAQEVKTKLDIKSCTHVEEVIPKVFTKNPLESGMVLSKL